MFKSLRQNLYKKINFCPFYIQYLILLTLRESATNKLSLLSTHISRGQIKSQLKNWRNRPFSSRMWILTVCSDAIRIKWFHSTGRGTSVCKPEFSGLIDHYYCMEVKVGHTYILVPVLSDVFSDTRWIERFTRVVELNASYLRRSSIMHNFCLFIIVTLHDNQEVPSGGAADIVRYPSS